MSNKKYHRYFVILDHEDEGFGIQSGKTPKGYTKIEVRNGKGVLTHYLQNIKYFEEAEYVYRAYLIGTRGTRAVYADHGILKVDKNGNGQLNWKFDAQNVDGKHTSIEHFNMVAIVAESTNSMHRRKEMKVPLIGFIDKQKVEWRHIFKKEIESQEQEQENFVKEEVKEEVKEVVDENIEELKTEEVIKEDATKEKIEETMEDVVVKKETVEEKEEVKEVEEIVKEEVEVEEEIVKQEVEEESLNKEIRSETIEEHCEKDEEEYQYYQYYFKMTCQYVISMLGYHPEVMPFEKNTANCRWWNMDCTSQTMYRDCVPFYGYLTEMEEYKEAPNYMADCDQLISKYKHYIFGIKYDMNHQTEYYVYGVPGRFMESEQPYEGMTGFVYWHPVEDKKREKEDYGYWLLHIDAKTGKVVVPINPTPPPRY